MSERKVLQKYYPPDFDPSSIKRTKGPKQAGPKVITVRLMAPFSMRCTACGEFIYKGRKFNARKETAEEKYLGIAIYRFYIRCTRCSGEIIFRTDPRVMDYRCERGAKRNFEPWREEKEEVTDEQHLNMLEQQEVEAENDTMKGLEERTMDAKNEMAVADALDEIRTRNARREADVRAEKEISVKEMVDWEKHRQEREDEEAARTAFLSATGEKIKRLVPEEADEDAGLEEHTVNWGNGQSDMATEFKFKKVAKPKKDFAAALGLKNGANTKAASPAVAKASTTKAMPPPPLEKPVPSLLTGYGSDSD